MLTHPREYLENRRLRDEPVEEHEDQIRLQLRVQVVQRIDLLNITQRSVPVRRSATRRRLRLRASSERREWAPRDAEARLVCTGTTGNNHCASAAQVNGEITIDAFSPHLYS